MNSRTRAQHKAHREATRICRESRCLLCGQWGCDPAHWPKHRGMGGAKVGWEWGTYIPLCRRDHDLVDGRSGVSDAVESKRTAALLRLEVVAARFWGTT